MMQQGSKTQKCPLHFLVWMMTSPWAHVLTTSTRWSCLVGWRSPCGRSFPLWPGSKEGCRFDSWWCEIPLEASVITPTPPPPLAEDRTLVYISSSFLLSCFQAVKLSYCLDKIVLRSRPWRPPCSWFLLSGRINKQMDIWWKKEVQKKPSTKVFFYLFFLGESSQIICLPALAAWIKTLISTNHLRWFGWFVFSLIKLWVVCFFLPELQ